MEQIYEIQKLLIFLKEKSEGFSNLFFYFNEDGKFVNLKKGLSLIFKDLKSSYNFKNKKAGPQEMQDLKYFLAFLKARQVAPKFLEELYQKVKDKR